MTHPNTLVEDKLKEIFGFVNNWLNFAEAKNGAIIVLNGACIIGLLTVLFGNDMKIPQWIRLHLDISVILLILSTGISLISFFPMTNKFIDRGNNNNQSPILLFFGDIAQCKSSRQFVLSIYKDYYNDTVKTERDITKLEDDYAKEIIYNSQITVRKYKYFKMSLVLTISAFVSLPLVIIVYTIKGIIKIFK